MSDTPIGIITESTLRVAARPGGCRRLTVALLIGVVILAHPCFPKPRATAPAATPRQPAKAAASVAKRPVTADTVAAPPPAVPVAKWKGRAFVLLRKNRMFEKFGYELYVDKGYASRSAASLSNGRLRADLFAGKRMVAQSVTAIGGGERSIVFRLDTLGITVTATTRSGTVEGIAPAGDLDEARKRWLGDTVYSVRRSIDTYDSASARFGSVKVSLGDPLRVTDVVWGATPLPPKPIWIAVQTAGGARGFIPIHYSWTNVLADKRISEIPWEADVLEQDPRKLYKWDEHVWNTIDSHNIFAGMTRSQVRMSWGGPVRVERDSTATEAVVEKWFYDGNTLVFSGDSLTGQ